MRLLPSWTILIRFLLQYYELPDETVDEIKCHVVFFIMKGEKPGEIIDYLQELMEFPSKEFLDGLTLLLAEAYNHTRQWALKGHSSGGKELSDTTQYGMFIIEYDEWRTALYV